MCSDHEVFFTRFFPVSVLSKKYMICQPNLVFVGMLPVQWRLLNEVVHPAGQGGPSYRPVTHYELKAAAANRTVWDFEFLLTTSPSLELSDRALWYILHTKPTTLLFIRLRWSQSLLSQPSITKNWMLPKIRQLYENLCTLLVRSWARVSILLLSVIR